MSLLTGLQLKNADAVLAASKNSAQQKLIRDVPTMIECLIIMVNFQLAKTARTHEMLVSYIAGFNKYGTLSPPMLDTLKSIILQHSNEIHAVLQSVQQPNTPRTSSPTQREPGDESENSLTDHDEDPFS